MSCDGSRRKASLEILDTALRTAAQRRNCQERRNIPQKKYASSEIISVNVRVKDSKKTYLLRSTLLKKAKMGAASGIFGRRPAAAGQRRFLTFGKDCLIAS
jgi:hypothetical protein